MAKDGIGNIEITSERNVIRSDGSLNKDLLTVQFKKLKDSYSQDYNNACWSYNDRGQLIADAKRELILDLADVFGLEDI